MTGPFGNRRGGKGGPANYADKATVNRTPKYGGLYGQPAQVITIAGVLYQWTGTAIQAFTPGTTDPAPTAPPNAPTISATPGNGFVTLALSALTATSRTASRTVNGVTTALAVGSATSYTDNGVTNEVLAAYSVYDTNGTGDSSAATASATPSASIVPPTTFLVNNLATRQITPVQLSTNNGTMQQQATRIRVHATRQVTAPIMEWANWYTTDTISPNDYYLTAALEVPNQTSTPDVYRLTFGGQSGVKVVAGTSVKSDASSLAGITLLAGASIYVRQHISVAAASGQFPLGHTAYNSRDEGTYAAAQTLTVDTAGAAINATSIPLNPATTRAIPAGVSLLFGTTLVTTSAASAAGVTSLPVNAIPAAIAAAATANHYDPTALSVAFTRSPSTSTPYPGPIRMSGTINANTPATVIGGDSIFAGLGDGSLNPSGTTGQYGIEYGWPRRVLNGSPRTVINLARSGERAQQVNTSTLFRYRLPYIASGDIFWMNYGTNDLQAGRTLAQVQADIQAIIAYVRARGASVVMTTILPRTNTTDAYATTTNQTPVAGFEAGSSSIRGQFNAWIRGGTGTVHDGYVEASDWVEVAANGTLTRDGGYWKPGYTADGVHPTQPASLAMSEGLTSAERTLVGAASTPYTFNTASLVGKYLLDETSGTTLTDGGMYAAYPGSLNTATRKAGGGLSFTGSATATLPTALTANLNGRTGIAMLLAFKVPATLPVGNTVLLSCTGLTVTAYGSGDATYPGKVRVDFGSSLVRSASALAAGDHTIGISIFNGYLVIDTDGLEGQAAAYSGVTALSGPLVLQGYDAHAFLAYGDSRLGPDREVAHKSLRYVLNQRSGVALP